MERDAALQDSSIEYGVSRERKPLQAYSLPVARSNITDHYMWPRIAMKVA